MGQGHKGELLGPTGLSAVKGKPRCRKTFPWLILLCTALHHQNRSFLPYLPPITHLALSP